MVLGIFRKVAQDRRKIGLKTLKQLRLTYSRFRGLLEANILRQAMKGTIGESARSSKIFMPSHYFLSNSSLPAIQGSQVRNLPCLFDLERSDLPLTVYSPSNPIQAEAS